MSDLDKKFSKWVESVAQLWKIPVAQAEVEIGRIEIQNRLEAYPRLAVALRQPKLDVSAIRVAAGDCLSLSQLNHAVKLNNFMKSAKAKSIIGSLVRNFPPSAQESEKRINSFIERAVANGFADSDGQVDRAGAALTASVFLSAMFRRRFVDYRYSRWSRFAGIMDYPWLYLDQKKNYGFMMSRAGRFARAIARTPSFKDAIKIHWPTVPANWILGGLTWLKDNPKRFPLEVDESVSDYELKQYPEGKSKARMHVIRERNRTLVERAKAIRKLEDRELQCDVCKFSFIEHYGSRGDGFIEAHHKVPLSKLTKKSRTRIEDLALVCANCHRMIHRGTETLTIPQAKALFRCHSA